MSLWLLLALVALVKLVVASLMVWIPMRSDSAMNVLEDQSGSEPDAGEDEGGSKTLAGAPVEPHPRLPRPPRPRRGPHGCPSIPSPSRVRKPPRRVVARSLARH
ncbi:MAG TPA: hypothetical protein VK691_05145 [Solirubrobacteraceae bacterium]|nr:hypothetical protein [Solirubrobacteraceae bacterium]